LFSGNVNDQRQRGDDDQKNENQQLLSELMTQKSELQGVVKKKDKLVNLLPNFVARPASNLMGARPWLVEEANQLDASIETKKQILAHLQNKINQASHQITLTKNFVNLESRIIDHKTTTETMQNILNGQEQTFGHQWKALNWKEKLKGNPIPWLLEADKTQPAIRYYTLRDILGRDENDKEVKAAKAAIMVSGPVPVILAAQHPDGYWGKGPRYTGTMRALVFLAQLGPFQQMIYFFSDKAGDLILNFKEGAEKRNGKCPQLACELRRRCADEKR